MILIVTKHQMEVRLPFLFNSICKQNNRVVFQQEKKLKHINSPRLQPSLPSDPRLLTQLKPWTLCILECFWHFKQRPNIRNTLRWEEQLVNVIRNKKHLQSHMENGSLSYGWWIVYVLLCLFTSPSASSPLLEGAAKLTYGSDSII